MTDSERILRMVAEIQAIRPPLARLHAMHRGMLDAAGIVTGGEALHYGLNLVAEAMAEMVRNGVSSRDLVTSVAAMLNSAMPLQPSPEAELEEVAEEAA